MCRKLRHDQAYQAGSKLLADAQGVSQRGGVARSIVGLKDGRLARRDE